MFDSIEYTLHFGEQIIIDKSKVSQMHSLRWYYGFTRPIIFHLQNNSYETLTYTIIHIPTRFLPAIQIWSYLWKV